jgi:tRNA(Ile)-lysidine synthetase-like protein
VEASPDTPSYAALPLADKLATPLDMPAIVAFSGGADSLAALLWAREHFGQAIAAIIDHGLIDGSGHRAEAAMRLAREAGAEPVLRSLHLGAGGQARARQARLLALAELARQNGAQRIITGHQASDLAETVLMRLARANCGIAGLSGFGTEDPFPLWPQGAGLTLLRPLLHQTRGEVRSALAGAGWDFVDDPANGMEHFERVRARAAIDQRNIHATLCRIAHRAATVDASYRELALRALHSAQIDHERAILAIDADRVFCEPRETAMRLFRAAAMMVSGRLSPLSTFAPEMLRDTLTTQPKMTLGHALWSREKTLIHITCDPRWQQEDRNGPVVETPVGAVIAGRWLIRGEVRIWLGQMIAERLLDGQPCKSGP